MENKQVKLGIIGAMDVEVATLMEHAQDAVISERAGMRFCEGTLAGMPVVIAKCGIGKVSAGMCVQVMCDLYGVTHIVNTGVAGSLDAAIDIADLVVSTDALYHDMDVTPLGYEPGQLPGMDCLAFPADPALRAAIEHAAAVAAPDVWASHTTPTTYVGWRKRAWTTWTKSAGTSHDSRTKASPLPCWAWNARTRSPPPSRTVCPSW